MPRNTGKTAEQIQKDIDKSKKEKPTETDDGAKDVNSYKALSVEALISKDVACQFVIPDYAVIGLGGYTQTKTGVTNDMIVIKPTSTKEQNSTSGKTPPRGLGDEVSASNTSGSGAIFGRLIRIGKAVTVPVTVENSLRQDYKGQKRNVKRITIRVHPLMTVTAIARFLQAFGTPPTWFRLKGGKTYNITGTVKNESLGETPPGLKKIVDKLKKAA